MRLVRADRPGIALLVVVLLTMVVAAIAAGAALIGSNSFLIAEYDQKSSLLEAAADAGLELNRARLNANPALFNDTMPSTLELDAVVSDAAGRTIDGISRTVYALPVGGGPGEYGSFSTLVSIAEDGDGARAIRRMDMLQESFATYAYFTDYEATNIAFGNNDQLYGPAHSNSNIKIRSTGATFHGPVTTAGVFEGAEYAVFQDDTMSQVTPILMPTLSQIERLKKRAEPGHMVISAPALGGAAQAGTRILFVSRDINGDGVKEGFIRVYRSTSDAAYVSGDVASSGLDYTPNCGHFEGDGAFSRVNGPQKDSYNHTSTQILTSSTRRCFLGGSDLLFATASYPQGRFTASDSWGAWVPFPGTVHSALSGQPDASYLYPLDRTLNSGFRGLIFVEGDAVVSGTVRGRVTVAASGRLVIGDDLVYQTDPATNTCADMLGLVAGGRIIVADNTLNAAVIPPGQTTYYSYDDTPSETIHASLLSLVEFTIENWSSGSTTAEPCSGTAWGRGCLHITGGLIQQSRGPVSSSIGHGYIKRYTHDTCAFTDPPPYFPTTGHFWRKRYYEVDPTGFDITKYFNALN